MSTYQPGLDAFDTPERARESAHERVLKDRGAEYGRASGRATTARGGPTNECLACGASIDSAIARVVGDENGCTPTCGTCNDEFGSTVTAVTRYYGGGL